MSPVRLELGWRARPSSQAAKPKLRLVWRNPRTSAEESARIASAVKDHLVDYLMSEAGVDRKHRERFKAGLTALIASLKTEDMRAELEGRPLRDYRPREGILNWLQAEDGAGPWLRAGLLTRPFLFHAAPKAYRALVNYETKNELPSGLSVPTRSDLLDEDLSELDHNAVTPGGRRRATQLYSALLGRRRRRKNGPEY